MGTPPIRVMFQIPYLEAIKINICICFFTNMHYFCETIAYATFRGYFCEHFLSLSIPPLHCTHLIFTVCIFIPFHLVFINLESYQTAVRFSLNRIIDVDCCFLTIWVLYLSHDQKKL